MSQVPLIRTQDLEPYMVVEGTDGHAREVRSVWSGIRLDIWFVDGTVVRDSHPLTLWRLR